MPITFTGVYPKHTRIETGCLSLDWAIAGMDFERNNLLGLPLRCGYHIYSKTTGLGKTLFSLSLLGMIGANTNRNLAVAPVDTFDMANMQTILEDAGFSDGQVEIILDPSSHSKTLERLTNSYKKLGVVGALLDSIPACLSTAAAEGEPEDSSVGRDAKMIATFVRQIYDATNHAKEDKVFLLTNTLFVDFGGGAKKGFGPPPMKPSRGVTPNLLTSLHIKLTQQYRKNKAVQNDFGRLLHGKVEKNNFGPTNREFDVYTIGGHGIHKGLTAVFDCLTYGVAEDKPGGKVAVGNFSARLSKMIEEWDTFDFSPFFDALQPIRESMISGASVSIPEPDGIEEESAEDLYNG